MLDTAHVLLFPVLFSRSRRPLHSPRPLQHCEFDPVFEKIVRDAAGA
ncbi:MAG: hypothetical protein WD155_01235 [Burkholderiales bacterium]